MKIKSTLTYSCTVSLKNKFKEKLTLTCSTYNFCGLTQYKFYNTAFMTFMLKVRNLKKKRG